MGKGEAGLYQNRDARAAFAHPTAALSSGAGAAIAGS
jgi:hypothetical protein